MTILDIFLQGLVRRDWDLNFEGSDCGIGFRIPLEVGAVGKGFPLGATMEKNGKFLIVFRLFDPVLPDTSPDVPEV